MSVLWAKVLIICAIKPIMASTATRDERFARAVVETSTPYS